MLLYELRQAAEDARSRVYAPHTGKVVLAAIKTTDGNVYGGANVEGRARTTKHAEEVTVLNAIHAGQGPAGQWISTLYVAGAFPCGVCRQFLSEFVIPDATVLIDPATQATVANWSLLKLVDRPPVRSFELLFPTA